MGKPTDDTPLSEAQQRYIEALRRAMDAAGWNQRTLAQKAATSESNLSQILGRKRFPGPGVATALTDALGIHACDLAALYAEAGRDSEVKTPGSPDAPARIPAELAELLRLVEQYTDDLPYRLRGNRRLAVSTLYVRQSVSSRTDVRTFTEGLPEELGLIEDIRRVSGLAQPFEEVFDQHDHLVIEGLAGVGKTTLGYHVANELKSGSSSPELIPLVLPARVLAEQMNQSWGEALRCAIGQEYETQIVEHLSPHLFTQPVGNARWLVIVDALDEIPDQDQRDRLLRALAARISDVEATARFLITTRPLSPGETDRLQGPRVGFYELQPFDEEALTRFARNWFNSSGTAAGAADAYEFLEQVSVAGLSGLLDVPLLASIAAIVFESRPGQGLPSSRYELYEEYIRSMLVAREASATAALDPLRAHPSGRELVSWLEDHRADLLQQLATAYVSRDTPLIEVAKEAILDVAPSPAQLPHGWEVQLAEWFAVTGLLGRHGTRLRFLHHTFAEHLAATARANTLPSTFVPGDPVWEQVLCGLQFEDDSAERVLLHYLHRRAPGSALLDWLLAGSIDHRAGASRLIQQGASCTDAQLKAAVSFIESRLCTGNYSADEVQELGGLTRHAWIRARFAKLLADPEGVQPELKVAIADLLRRHADFRHRDLLLALTEDDVHHKARVAASRVLAKLDAADRDRAAAVLRGVADDMAVPASDRHEAAKTLASLGGEYLARAASTLDRFAGDPTQAVYDRRAAAEILMTLGDGYRERAIEHMTALLAEERDAWWCSFVAEDLAKLGGSHRTRAVERLRELAADPGTPIWDHIQVVSTLATLDPEYRTEGAGKLLAFANDPRAAGYVRRKAAEELARLGVDHRVRGVELLAAIADDPTNESFERRWAAEQIPQLDARSPLGTVTLKRVASDVTIDADDRCEAAETVTKLNSTQHDWAAGVFYEIAVDPTVSLDDRARAAANLARLGDEQRQRVMATFDAALADKEAGDREQILAAAITGALDPDRSGLAALVIVLISNKLVHDPDILLFAAKALRNLGSPHRQRSAELAEEIAADSAAPGTTRKAAIDLLGSLGFVSAARVDEILEDLVTNPSMGPSDRGVAASALAQRGPRHRARVIESLKLLASPTSNGFQRISDADILVGLGGEAQRVGLDLLAGLATDPTQDPFDRRFAAVRLADLGGKWTDLATAALSELASERGYAGWSRRYAAEELISLGERYRQLAQTLLSELAHDPWVDPSDQAFAETILARYSCSRRADAAAALRRAMKPANRSSTRRPDAATMLASLGPEYRAEAAEALQHMAEDAYLDGADRCEAAMSLARIDPGRIARGVTLLRAIAIDPDVEGAQRVDAALALAKLASDEPDTAVDVLRDLAEHAGTDPHIRIRAGNELARLGPGPRLRAEQVLLELCWDSNVDPRHQLLVIWELADLGATARAGAHERLKQLASEDRGDPLLAGFVSATLVWFSDRWRRTAVERLTTLASDSSVSGLDRIQAALMLTRDRDEADRARDILVEVASDQGLRSWLRRQAAEALAQNTGKAGRNIAATTLESLTVEHDSDPWERAEAALALADLAPDRVTAARATLRAVGFDPAISHSQRVFALTSLLRFGGEEYLDSKRALGDIVLDPLAIDARWMAARAVGNHYDRSIGVHLLHQIAEGLTTDAPALPSVLGTLASMRYDQLAPATKTLQEIATDQGMPPSSRLLAARELTRLGGLNRFMALETLAGVVEDGRATEYERAQAHGTIAAHRATERPAAAKRLRRTALAANEAEIVAIAETMGGLEPTDREFAASTLRNLIIEHRDSDLRLQAAQSLATVMTVDGRVNSFVWPLHLASEL